MSENEKATLTSDADRRRKVADGHEGLERLRHALRRIFQRAEADARPPGAGKQA